MKKKFLIILPALLLGLTACKFPWQKGSSSEGGSSSSGQSQDSGSSQGGGSQGGSSQSGNVNYGSESSPLSISSVLTEVAKLSLADKAYSPQVFYATGMLASEMTEGTGDSAGSFKFNVSEGDTVMAASSARLEEGKSKTDYGVGYTLVIRSYVRADATKENGYYFSYNNSSQDIQNPAPTIISSTQGQKPGPTAITLNKTGTIELKQADSVTLEATISPAGAEGTVNWSVAMSDGSASDGKLTCTNGLVSADVSAVVNAVYTVTATIANTAISASVNVKITENNISGDQVTKTWIAKNAGYANAAEVTTFTIEAVNATFGKGTNASNPPKYYTSGEAVRVYGGNTMRFTSEKTITKIEFTFGASDGSNTISASTGGFSDNKWSGTSKDITFTVDGTSGNRRVAQIAVTYLVEGGEGGGGEDLTKLATPTGVTASGTTLTWTNVEHNSGYAYTINSNPAKTGNLAKDVTTLDAGTLSLAGGTYNFQIKAKGDGTTYSDSDYCTAVSFTVEGGEGGGGDGTLLYTINFKDNGTDSTTALTAAKFYTDGVASVKNAENTDITTTWSSAGLSAEPTKTFAGNGGLKCGSNSNAAEFTLNIPTAYQQPYSYVVINLKNSTRDVTITAASKSATISSGNADFTAKTGALNCTANATTLQVSITSASKTAAYIASIAVYVAA